MSIKMIACAGVAWALSVAGSQAATVLVSNWDDAPTGVPLANPVVSGIASWVGTPLVDIVEDGSFGIRCFNNAGKCADLAGSPGAINGTLTSSTLNAANSIVTVEFVYSGAQRTIAGARFLAELISATSGLPVASWTSPALPASVTFNTASITGDVGAARTFQIRFTHLGGTGNLNIGAIVDDVSYSSVIPEPSTWMLMIMGFGMIAAQLRRRHRAQTA
jgi:hypothetical protein